MRPDEESRFGDPRSSKGPSHRSAPETEADRTPRESLLAGMIANREPSNQSFETDREATVCTSEPSLLAVLGCEGRKLNRSLCQRCERHRGNQINPVFG